MSEPVETIGSSTTEGRRMATLEQDGWTLDNAENRHAEAPSTFHIPSKAERSGLQPGQMVQLLFLLLDKEADGSSVIVCEKMWVTIRSASPQGYEGMLESLPVTSEALAPEASVRFEPEHVASVFIRKTDPRHPEYRASGGAET